MATRVYEISKELDMENKEVMEILRSRGFEIKSASSAVDNITAEAFIEEFSNNPQTNDSHPIYVENATHLSNGIRKIIQISKKKGYVTVENINEAIPESINNPGEIESIISLLEDLEIEILTKDETENIRHHKDKQAIQSKSGQFIHSNKYQVSQKETAAENVFESNFDSNNFKSQALNSDGLTNHELLRILNEERSNFNGSESQISKIQGLLAALRSTNGNTEEIDQIQQELRDYIKKKQHSLGK